MNNTANKHYPRSRWFIQRQNLLARITSLQKQWRLFRQQPLGMIGVLLIIIFGLMVPAQPILMKTIWDRRRYDPYVGFDIEMMPHPSSPSSIHLLGTDGMGRDIFSQLLYGSRNSFRVGIGAAIIAITISTLLGGIAGYFGGAMDIFLMGISDVFTLLPAVIILLLFGLIIKMNWFLVALTYGIFTGLGRQAIVTKAQAVSLKTKSYIESARIAGGNHLHIFSKHILPGLIPIALVHAVMTVVGAVLTESLLAYFSRTQDYMSWGSMIWMGQRTFRWFNFKGTWSTIVPPALSIMLFCSAFYLVGRALDDVLNPRLRKR
ncbi:MAG TPA: ABC transporter permease [Anaerolineae bacterium]|nr:ABC transporter permease [Anaerolineae bacterium]